MNYLIRDKVTCDCPTRRHRFTVFSSKWTEGEDHWLAVTFGNRAEAIKNADTFAIHSRPAIIKVFCELHKKGMVDIQPDRTNWKLFCKEPRLTDEEHAEWKEMCKVIIEDDNVFVFVEKGTEAEWKEAMMKKPTEGWSDVIKWADTNRRLARAEIKAWEAWKSTEYNPDYVAIARKQLGLERE